jgi:hypothetical protein
MTEPTPPHQPPPPPQEPLAWLRGAWDVIVGITGLTCFVLLVIAPAVGLPEVRSPEAWAAAAGAAGILPVNRAAQSLARAVTRSGDSS